jgi:hypothetical protein
MERIAGVASKERTNLASERCSPSNREPQEPQIRFLLRQESSGGSRDGAVARGTLWKQTITLNK